MNVELPHKSNLDQIHNAIPKRVLTKNKQFNLYNMILDCSNKCIKL